MVGHKDLANAHDPSGQTIWLSSHFLNSTALVQWAFWVWQLPSEQAIGLFDGHVIRVGQSLWFALQSPLAHLYGWLLGHLITYLQDSTDFTHDPSGHLTDVSSGHEDLVEHIEVLFTHLPSQQWYYPGKQVLTTQSLLC